MRWRTQSKRVDPIFQKKLDSLPLGESGLEMPRCDFKWFGPVQAPFAMCVPVQTRGVQYCSNKALCPDALAQMMNPSIRHLNQEPAHTGVANDAMAVEQESPNHGFAPRTAPAELIVGSDDVAMDDWDDLLNAVKARMLTTARDVPYDSSNRQRQLFIEQVQTDVLDCVAALEHLHSSLTNELAKHKYLKLEIAAAQAALARQHVELIGTRAQERRARHLSRHDSLTSLPNRGYFCQRLDQALAEERASNNPPQLAVLFMDLDSFKQINDTHGHDIGNKVLQTVASRLKKSVRTSDVVSRIGGDEFACLLIGFPEREQIRRQADKITDAVASTMIFGEIELTIRPSIGTALFPDDGLTAEELLKEADAAMYQAKRSQSEFALLTQDPA